MHLSPKMKGDQLESSLIRLNDSDYHDAVDCQKNHKIKRIIYSDDEETVEKLSNKNSKISKGAHEIIAKTCLIDEDSDFSELNKSEDEQIDNCLTGIQQESNVRQLNNKKQETKTNNKDKDIKVSNNGVSTIQSEQQRLHREAQISVPYHKPRKYTLEEFLKRRTIIKPELTNNGQCFSLRSSLITADIHQKKSSKMSAEELEVYAKLMEERAKECSEFFKTVYENENLKNNDDVHSDVQCKKENITHMLDKSDFCETKLYEERLSEKQVDHNSDTVQQLSEADLEEILQQEEKLTKPLASEISFPSEVIGSSRINVNISKKPPLINVKKLLLKNKQFCDKPLIREINLIDLDIENIDVPCGEQQSSNADRLMNRLMATLNKRDSAIEQNNSELQMNTHLKEKNKKFSCTRSKLGVAHLKFKRSLKEIIKMKRVAELKNKQSECISNGEQMEEKEEDKEKSPCKKNDELVEVSDEEKESEEEVFEEENTDFMKQHNEECIDEYSSQADDDEENEEEEKDDKCKAIKLKNHIIKPYYDGNDSENDDINFLKTQSLTSTKDSVHVSLNDMFALDDIDMVNKNLNENRKGPIISQIPVMQNINQQSVNDDKEVEELIQLCSGSFPIQTQKQTNTKISEEVVEERFSSDVEIVYNKFSHSDSSEDEDKNFDSSKKLTGDHQKTKKIKRLKKTLKKKRIFNLDFSDDEGENEDKEKRNAQNNGRIEEEETKEIEHLKTQSAIVFDSEESLVEIAKDECLKQAATFFENEAELSESDWTSDDEEEGNLDQYDIELGDEDEFDQNKLHRELEKIHARKMLDEDIREVSKIREFLLEDQEEECAIRQRQFRWRNINTGDFSLDDIEQQQQNENNELKNNTEEEIPEQIWRKVRYERDMLLEKYKTTVDSDKQTSNDTCNLNRKIFRKDAFSSMVKSTENIKQSSFLIAKDFSFVRHKKIARESFLLRDQEILQKVANLSKETNGTNFRTDEETTTLIINTNKAKKFTFATLTPEEHAKLKRKSNDVLNSSNELQEHQQLNDNDTKKMKLECRNKCLIDQLL